MTPLDAAKLNLASLEGKLADARAWSLKVAAEARTLAYDAHVEGGESANRLKELQGLALAGEQNIVSIETAITEARKRLAAAQAGEHDEAEQAKARMALVF
jgi:hypothetical protein